MKHLGIFLAISLMLHLLLLLVSWPVPAIDADTEPMLTMVEFTPFSKNEPVTAPAQPTQQPTAPAPTPAEQPQEPPSDPQDSNPQPDNQANALPADTNTQNTPTPDTTDPLAGEVDIAAADNSTPNNQAGNVPIAEETPPDSTEPDPNNQPDDVPAPSDASATEPEETPSVEIQPIDPDTETDTENPEEQPAPEAPEEIDRRVDVPNNPTFISDRITGEFEFAGQGRRLTNSPTVSNFRLTRNITVRIPFKIDSDGRPFDIRIPPLSSSEVEQMLRTLVSSMRFNALPTAGEPDAATLTINLQVR